MNICNDTALVKKRDHFILKTTPMNKNTCLFLISMHNKLKYFIFKNVIENEGRAVQENFIKDLSVILCALLSP